MTANNMTVRPFLIGVVAASAGLLLVGCPEDDDKAASNACSGAQALSAPNDIFAGEDLPAKTLALTFDDGPASRTLELSAWLKSQNIRAAFFVNGQKVSDANVLQSVEADGHLVGNHTQTHADLVNAYGDGGAAAASIVKELDDTDKIIAPFVDKGRFLFRAPYGSYDEFVFNALQASPMKKYVGHIDWAIGGQYIAGQAAADWSCWQDHYATSKACGDLYLKEIDSVGKGIVLMHDQDYGDPTNTNIKAGVGNTIDMVKYMVPLLKTKGFTFVRVDEVPRIAALLPSPVIDAGAAVDASSGTDTPPTDLPTNSGGSNPCANGAPTTALRSERSSHAH